MSPLTALIMDQRNKFTVCGKPTEFIGELQLALEGTKKGNIKLLFMIPESLLRNSQWREMLLSPIYQRKLVALAVDEAHCIVQW